MHVWVIRGGDHNRLVDEFVDADVTGVGFYAVPDGRTVTRSEVSRLLREERKSAAVDWATSMFATFVHDITNGDVVVMPDTPRGEVILGEVHGDYRYEERVPLERYRHRRVVKWFARHAISELPPGEQSLYKQRVTLSERTSPGMLEHIDRVRRGELGRPPRERPIRKPTRARCDSTKAVQRVRGVERLCPGCGYLKATQQFGTGELCVDCV